MPSSAIGSASLIGAWAMPREAVRALILHAFDTGGFDYLTVGHFSDNPASARIIAKFGFEPAGEVLRDCAARGNKARCAYV